MTIVGTNVTSTTLPGSCCELQSISGLSSTDIWVVGCSKVWHWDGVSWTEIPNHAAPMTIAALGPNDVWVGSYSMAHWDGSSWQYDPLWTNKLARIRGSSQGVYAVGLNGFIGHLTSNGWSEVSCGERGDIVSVWAENDEAAWATEGYENLWEAHLRRRTASGWAFMSLPGIGPLASVYGVSPSNVWAVGGGGASGYAAVAVHFDGQIWAPYTIPAPMSLATGTWAAGLNDAWASGVQGELAHWDGQAWSTSSIRLSGNLWGMSGTASNDVWAVGNPVAHYDGTSWSTLLGGEYPAVFAVAPGEIWLGDVGGVSRFDGSLTLFPIPDPGGGYYYFNSVWGAASNDLWTVGGLGTIAHFDGTSWTRMKTGFDGTLRCIHGSGPSNVWAVGTGGAILHHGP